VAKLTGAKKAAFLRRMAAGRKKAARTNAGSSFRKLKKKLKKSGRTSAQMSRLKKDIRKASADLRSNPPKMRKLGNAGTGWIQAERVKIVRRRGKPPEVLIQRPKRRRK
jgi:hypothetical protein